MASNYLDQYLNLAPFAHALWRAAEAYQLNRVKRQLRFGHPILDLGCGFGEFAGVFFKSNIEVGIDISGADLLRAASRKKYRRLQVEDARHLSFPANTFATIISISVLEHIPRVHQVIKEAFRVLKPGGYLIFTVPTSRLNRYLFSPKLINLLFRHVNLWPASRWQELLSRTGFKLISSTTFIPPPMVKIWQLFLITALPSQLFRWVTGRRLIWKLAWKNRLLNRFFGHLVTESSASGCNLLIVAQKPS